MAITIKFSFREVKIVRYTCKDGNLVLWARLKGDVKHDFELCIQFPTL